MNKNTCKHYIWKRTTAFKVSANGEIVPTGNPNGGYHCQECNLVFKNYRELEESRKVSKFISMIKKVD